MRQPTDRLSAVLAQLARTGNRLAGSQRETLVAELQQLLYWAEARLEDDEVEDLAEE